MLADFVDGADVGMVERGGGAGLALEALERARVAGQVCREEFQRDEAAEFRVLGFVDDTHPATAEPFDDAVVRDGLADQ